MVSNIGDSWTEDFPKKWPEIYPKVYPEKETWIIQNGVHQEEFNKLKKEVEELKNLLLAAKKFDEETGQPDCEMEQKVKLIKDIAKLVGVDLSEVFK